MGSHCIDCVTGLPDFVYDPARYVECVTTHLLPVVLHVRAYINLRMAWWFCSSYQIWSHSFDALRLWSTRSQCIDCVQGLSDLGHAPTRHVEWVSYTSMVCGSLCKTTVHQDADDLVIVVFFFSPDLIPQLGCFEACMNRILVLLIVSQVCYTLSMHTQKPCRMGGNISMFNICGSSCTNIHDHEDGIIILQFLPDLVQELGCYEAWMDRIIVHWFISELVHTHIRHVE